jgi:hypothetical protein
MSENTSTPKNLVEPTYLTWNSPEELSGILANLDLEQEMGYSKAGLHSRTRDLLPGVSGRPGLKRSDYNSFRPHETVPTKIKDIIARADEIYRRNGLVRNIIDLMGDFACQGIRLSHPDKRIETFYRVWFNKVHGKNRSERFLNNLYRTANVIIRRQEAKITLKQRSKFFKSFGAETVFPDQKFLKNVVPAKYTFLNPITVDVVGGELAAFTNIKQYVLNIPKKITGLLNPGEESANKRMIKELPNDIRKALNTGKPYPLPPDKTLVFHYKKDDWDAWAEPMVSAIMEDIIMLDKLKLCDMAALDGAISHVRIFKLGDMEHGIIPAPGAVSKLKNIITSHVGGGTIDIVWGPDIQLIESKTDIHEFLGGVKYEPVLNNIYGGLGMPPTLTGSFSASGTTNNFVSLKTLIQRLQYGRDVLCSFWDAEIAIVQKAMGFSEPATCEYDYPDLGDSDSEKALLIQMADRNLISDELLQERFGHSTKMENVRIDKENQAREEGNKTKKGSPFHEMILQPGQAEKQSELRIKEQPAITSKGQPNQGRPQNSKDSKQRKKKTFKPKTKAALELWAITAQNVISEILNPKIIKSLEKKNMRSLSSKEYKLADNIKFNVLFNLEPFIDLTKKNILEAFYDKSNNSNVYTAYNIDKGIISKQLNRVLTVEELKNIQAKIYINQFEDEHAN